MVNQTWFPLNYTSICQIFIYLFFIFFYLLVISLYIIMRLQILIYWKMYLVLLQWYFLFCFLLQTFEKTIMKRGNIKKIYLFLSSYLNILKFNFCLLVALIVADIVVGFGRFVIRENNVLLLINNQCVIILKFLFKRMLKTKTKAVKKLKVDKYYKVYFIF